MLKLLPLFRFICLSGMVAVVCLNAPALAEPSDEEIDGVALEEVALDDAQDFEESLSKNGNKPVNDKPAPTSESLAPLKQDAQSGGSGLVLTTTKIGIPLNHVGTSATVITRQQIQNMQATSIYDILRGVPGMDIVQTGSPGNAGSIFMRGMNSEHTLVMIDGVRLNDPISPGRSVNYFDQISPDAIERVEILRGPQGPLYGSDSIGGVINIITRDGEPGKPTLSARVSAGSYGTLQESINLGGQYRDKLKSHFHVTRQDVRGFSSASNRYAGNAELDGYHNTTLNGRVQYTPFRQWSLDLNSFYSKARFDLDNFGGAYGDDPNYASDNRMLLLSGASRLKLFDEKFEQVVRLSLTDLKRNTDNDLDILNPYDKSNSTYIGKLLNLDAQHNFYLHRTNTLTAGLNMKHEWGNSVYTSSSQFGPFNSEMTDRSATNMAFYAQDYIQLWDRWFTTVGFRSDHHNRFGHYNTYRAASTFLIKETGTSLKGSFGTGFKAPTLSQLYGAFGANLDLQPETSQGWDVGIEQNLLKNRIQLGATVFQNHIKNLIQYNSFFTYENVNKARTQGIEATVTTHPFKNLRVQSSYTYTDTKDLSMGGLDSGKMLLRRPRNKFSINVNYQPIKRLNLNVDLTHYGYRDDKDFNVFPTQRVRLSSFTLLNLAATLKVTDHLDVFCRIVNFLDSPYETVKGYASPRFSAYGGIKMAL